MTVLCFCIVAQLQRVQPIHVTVYHSPATSPPAQLKARLTQIAGALKAPVNYSIPITISFSSPPVFPFPLTASTSYSSIDDFLSPPTQPPPISSYAGITLPPLHVLLIESADATAALSDRWYMGRHHHAFSFIQHLHDESALHASLDRLTRLLQHVLSFHTSDPADTRQWTYAPSLHLSCTLLTSQPSPHTYIWPFTAIVERTLRPFIRALPPLLEVSVDGQSVQYADIAPNAVRVEGDNGSSVWQVSSDELRHFVGNTRWNVESVLHLETIDLVAYIPPPHQRPLLVHHTTATPTSSSSPPHISQADGFIVPRWGAVAFMNGELNDSRNVSAQVAELSAAVTQHVMARFVGMVRIMLALPDGVYPNAADTSAFVLLPSPVGLAEWEYYALFSRLLSLSLLTTLRNMQGLYDLVASVRHMPVSAAIAQQSEQAVTQARQAVAQCAASEWSECGRSARAAGVSAHDAFYAESLLPSLYFPDEHLYAVYLPLFLPITMPVLGAVLARLRRREVTKEKVS